MVFLKVYWQKLKNEMQSILVTNKDYALKLMSLSDSARDAIFKRYKEYTIDRFTLRFIEFR